MQRLTKALAPEDQVIAVGSEREDFVVSEVSGIGMPKQTLDIDEPTAYRAAPYPEADPQETSDESLSSFKKGEEGPVLRAARALADVRLRAEESGFLKRHHQKDDSSDSQITAIPPVFDNVTASPASQEEVQIPQVSTTSSSFEMPQGPLRVRLDAFAVWAMQMADASRIVIVDGQGYPLLHRDSGEGASEGDAAMVDSAMRLTSVLEQMQGRTDFARDGAMNLPMEDGGWLGVLRCENAGGRLCIAMVTPVPLEIEKSALMKNELARTMEAKA